MKIHAGVGATNSLSELRSSGLLSESLLTNELRRPKIEKGTVISIRLSQEMSEALELLAFKFDKPRGHIAKTFIEAAIFQVGGEFGLLDEKGTKAFSELMNYEKKLWQEKSKKQ